MVSPWAKKPAIRKNSRTEALGGDWLMTSTRRVHLKEKRKKEQTKKGHALGGWAVKLFLSYLAEVENASGVYFIGSILAVVSEIIAVSRSLRRNMAEKYRREILTR